MAPISGHAGGNGGTREIAAQSPQDTLFTLQKVTFFLKENEVKEGFQA